MVQEQTVTYDAEQKTWTSAAYPFWKFINRTLGEAFLQTMRSIDESKVLEYYYDTGLEKTAGEIYRQSVTVAKNLQKLGIKKDDVIVLYSMNNPLTTPLTFGSYMVGAIVNFFETKLHEKHIDNTLENIEPTVILFEEQCRDDLHASLKRCQLPSLKHLISIDAHLPPNVESELFRSVSATEIEQFQALKLGDPKEEIASYLLTSGTTGVPKVIMLSHAIMLHGTITWWCHTNNPAIIGADSVVFSFSPLRWISQVEMMFQSVILGVKRVCASGFPEGAYGREIIRKSKITHFFTPPSTFLDILHSTAEDDGAAFDSLKTVILGGETTPQTVLDLAKKTARNCKIYQCYGMTELSAVITNDEHINGGQMVPGLQMKILDENLKPVGPNERGQLYIKAPVPYKGYRKIDNSMYNFEDGFLLNGDYGFMDERNNLHIESRYKDLVRAKDNVILIPNNIEVMIIELPAIITARLVGYKKSPTDNFESGVLFAVLQQNFTDNPEAIRKKIRHVLSTQITAEQLKNVKEIFFIDKLPLTTSGKVDRIALRTKASQMLSSCD